MIWHIFKKDLRRLLPVVIGIVLADFAYAALQVQLGHFIADHRMLAQFTLLLSFLISAVVFFLVVAVVQLDPVPEDRQDWLVRPINRWDLLWSKLLFVALCIQVPLFASNVYQGLASGFSLHETLGAALSWNAYMFGSVGITRFPGPLIALAIGAATQSIGQMLAVGVSAALGTLVVALGLSFAIYGQDGGGEGNQLSLAPWIFSVAVILSCSVAILGLQYFRRATKTTYVVIGAGSFLLWASFALISQSTALAVQSSFSSAPGRTISALFAPEAPKHRVSAMGDLDASYLTAQGYVPIYLPIRVDGIPSELMTVTEDVHAVFKGSDGRTEAYRTGLNRPLHVPGQADAPNPIYQVLWVSPEFYHNHADQPVAVDIDFTLGILRPHGSFEIAPVKGVGNVPGGPSCATRLNPGRGIQLACLQLGNLPDRLSGGLFDHRTRLRNPVITQFMYSDAPYSAGDDMVGRFGANLPFRAPDTGAPYPVGPAQLATSSVVVATSVPLTHVMRHITIRDLRLGQWKAEIPGAGP